MTFLEYFRPIYRIRCWCGIFKFFSKQRATPFRNVVKFFSTIETPLTRCNQKFLPLEYIRYEKNSIFYLSRALRSQRIYLNVLCGFPLLVKKVRGLCEGGWSWESVSSGRLTALTHTHMKGCQTSSDGIPRSDPGMLAMSSMPLQPTAQYKEFTHVFQSTLAFVRRYLWSMLAMEWCPHRPIIQRTSRRSE